MEPEVHPEPNQPQGLLAALVPFGVLVQPEVALTRSIWWLLGLEGAAGALDGLVRRNGIEPDINGYWLTEVVGKELGRTDLEYRWGDPSETRVVVEAKIGHALTVDQIAGYADRLGGDAGLLVVLVPEARRLEGVQVIREYHDRYPDGRVRVDVWTFDEVTSELEAHLPGSPDVAQFKGLVQASRALDIFPLSQEQLMDDNPARREDVWRVVDSASFGLFGRRLPMGSDWSLAQRRYVELVPYAIGLAVGVGRKSRVHEGQPQPWAWLRLPDTATFSWVAQSVVERLRPGETSRDQDGLWLPLHLPTEAPGSVMIQEIRAQIETIGNEIREAIDQAVERELDPLAPELKKLVTAVLGMPPIDPADLLDDSPTRRADIELILREAARSFFDGKINPLRGDDDYLLNRYIRVETLDTHVSPSIGRQTRPAGNRPQPWAWLRVHEDTSHAEIAYEGLEQLAPSRVVVDRHGRAIPLEIPTDATGPKMLEAVLGQIHQAMVGIRAAIRTHHASDLEA